MQCYTCLMNCQNVLNIKSIKCCHLFFFAVYKSVLKLKLFFSDMIHDLRTINFAKRSVWYYITYNEIFVRQNLKAGINYIHIKIQWLNVRRNKKSKDNKTFKIIIWFDAIFEKLFCNSFEYKMKILILFHHAFVNSLYFAYIMVIMGILTQR